MKQTSCRPWRAFCVVVVSRLIFQAARQSEAPSMTNSPGNPVDLEQENVELRSALAEAQVRATAIAEVLQVISRSAFDLNSVFTTVIDSAIWLCGADIAGIYQGENGEYHRVLGRGVSGEYDRMQADLRVRPGPGTLIGRAVLERRTVHIEDAWNDPLYELKEDARVGGAHT